jgi:hypothetical protein
VTAQKVFKADAPPHELLLRTLNIFLTVGINRETEILCLPLADNGFTLCPIILSEGA